MTDEQFPGEPALRVLSLGGGTQSSVLALRAARGELDVPMPDCAVWADTGNEPPTTHAMIDWLASVLPFPVHRVKAEVDILTALRNGTDSRGNAVGGGIPLFTVNADGSHGQQGRWCTDNWKLRQIQRKVRELLGVGYRQRVPKGTWVEQWLGISLDEVQRMRTAADKWVLNRYPLIEARLDRQDCRVWWARNAPADAPPLARSACVICPYHSDREWLELEDDFPEMINAAAAAEAGCRERQAERGYGHISQYLHASRVPLREALDRARANREDRPAMFSEAECSGMCGL